MTLDTRQAQHVAVLGAGAWGTALAAAASAHSPTLLWARDPQLIAQCAATHQNARYLPGIDLPARLEFTADLDEAIEHASCGADPGLIILGVPLAGLRQTCASIAEKLQRLNRPLAGVVWTCKGLEADTGKLPSEIVSDAFRACPDLAVGVLSGPSFAQEVALGLPVALTIASSSKALRQATISALHGGNVRVYASQDLIGVEVGGALKNVIAIACGIADGLGLGTNARAALITRGLAEMIRFGEALGAQAATFSGLTGLGDLVLSATGDLSRNRQVGLAIGQGKTLGEVLSLGLTAEGARCARAVHARALALNIDLPITSAVCAVLFDQVAPSIAVTKLLSRDATTEY